MNQSDDFYDIDALKGWLTGNAVGYDVVEIDTILLGDLVNAGVLSPQTIASSTTADLHPAAVTAVQFNQAYYGFPHLLCAFFFMIRTHRTPQTRTIGELVADLGSAPSSVYRIVGNLNSSWELPALWIDSVRDTFYFTPQVEAEALHHYGKYPLDGLRQLARLCDLIGGRNPAWMVLFKMPIK